MIVIEQSLAYNLVRLKMSEGEDLDGGRAKKRNGAGNSLYSTSG
jgi:hypothetical protein